MNRVFVNEVLLREGQQANEVKVDPEGAVQLAQAFDDYGVDGIEIGYAAASEGEREAMRRIVRSVHRPVLASLAALKRPEVDHAIRTLDGATHPRIHLYVPSSKDHREIRLHRTEQQVLEMIDTEVSYARRYCGDVQFSPEEATGTDWEFLLACCETAVKAGATTINVPDTLGRLLYFQYGDMITWLLERSELLRRVVISTHVHADLEMAHSSTLEGVRRGARQIETCYLGRGERIGMPMTHLMPVLLERAGYQTEITLPKSWALAQLVHLKMAIEIGDHVQLLSQRAWQQGAGVHADGHLKGQLYKTAGDLTPEMFGVVVDEPITISRHSGRRVIRHGLESKLGLTVTDDQVERVYEAMMQLCDRERAVTWEDFAEVANEVLAYVPVRYRIAEPTKEEITADPEKLKLLPFSGSDSFEEGWTETKLSVLRTIRLDPSGQPMEPEKVMLVFGRANTPVEAALNAVHKATIRVHEYELVSYSVVGVGTAVNEQAPAKGSVQIRDQHGNIHYGHAWHRDVVKAGAFAVIRALNRLAAHPDNQPSADWREYYDSNQSQKTLSIVLL